MRYFIFFILFSLSVKANQDFSCIGIVRTESNVFYSEWNFIYNHIEGLVNINYANKNRQALFRITKNKNGNINGSGKWVSNRMNKNSFLRLFYKLDDRTFILNMIIEPLEYFRVQGKCN